MTEAKKPRFIAVNVPIHNSEITVYASPKLAEALKVINEMSMFQGVKILQLIEV